MTEHEIREDNAHGLAEDGDLVRAEFTGEEYQNMMISILMQCKHRRLFWTTNGLYGIGPSCLREGDIVVALDMTDRRFNYTFALRPRETTGEYLFLGQAYIDALVTGRVKDRIEAGEFEVKDFCLI